MQYRTFPVIIGVYICRGPLTKQMISAFVAVVDHLEALQGADVRFLNIRSAMSQSEDLLNSN